MVDVPKPDVNDDKPAARLGRTMTSHFAGVVASMMQPWVSAQQHWWKLAMNTGLRARHEMMKSTIRKQINDWLDADAKRHVQDDGTSAGGRFYHHNKNEMQAMLDRMAEPLRVFYKHQLMNNPQIQDQMRGDLMVEMFRFTDSVIRERYPDDHGMLYKPEYNHKFLTEESHTPDSHGKVVAIDADEIVKLFARPKKGRGDKFPHIIITSSHAQGETLNDVRSITHGIEALARDSEGQQLPHGYRDQGVKPGQTLTIYACDVEQTPWLNGAALLTRVNELKRIAATGKPEEDFNEISPGAKRIAKLMLKCMVEKPEAIDVNDPRTMGMIAAGQRTPITLRADAVEVAHHFKLIGYSKGGNVVSDAMRYLVSELTATNAKGQDVFTKHTQSLTRTPDDRSMSQKNVRNLVRSIAVMAIASVEMGMSERDKAYGVRRVAFNNQEDLISAHDNYKDCLYDERWIIDGVTENVGHSPVDMMGARGGIRGYAHNDPRVARRLKEAFASNFGKAAIGHVLFNGRAAQGDITIEAATGTTDAQIEAYRGEIMKALKQAGMGKAQLVNDHQNPGIFTLSMPHCDFTCDVRALEQLKQAFSDLRHHTQGLVIAQAILDEEIQGQIAKATPQARILEAKLAQRSHLGKYAMRG